MAKNRVIAGDHNGCAVMMVLGLPFISTGITTRIELDKQNVESYEVMDETQRKSAAGVAGRALAGGLLLGPAGLLAGALTAKTKGTYVVAIQFKNGKKSLLEVNEKIYKALMRSLF